MLEGPTVTVAATVVGWLALEAVAALSASGVPMPREIGVVCAVFAGPLAGAALARNVLAIWRGPPLFAFSGEAMRCGPAEAEAIRSSARLRGTMGGAGHLHRSRLAFPILAWAGAITVAAQLAFPAALGGAGPWPPIIAVIAAFGAWLFPSRPYWYREVTGGGVLVTPPEAAASLIPRGEREKADEPRQSA